MPKRNARKAKIQSKTNVPQRVEAVDRALSIVRCFTDRDAMLTLSAIAERTGYYKSTILRLAASLEAAGFLLRQPDKSFMLGHELLRLGTIYQRSFRLESYVRPTLKKLLAATGESTTFFVRQGNRRVCLMREDSAHSIRDHVNEGDHLTLEKGAAGHVLSEAERLTSNAEGRPFKQIPIFSFGERDPDAAAGAVPIFGNSDNGPVLVGALTVSGPRARFTPQTVAKIREQLMVYGANLSSQLGGGEYWDKFTGDH